MSPIKRFLANGGLRRSLEIAIQLIIYLLILSFLLGKNKSEFDIIKDRVQKIEYDYQVNLVDIKERLARVEENQKRILEILQGRYK